MNVGILTFHNAHNYGAVLQAYALKKTVELLGHNVEIVNYRNKTIEKKYRTKLESNVNYKRIYRKNELKKFIDFKINAVTAQKNWSVQCENFKNFIDKYLVCGEAVSFDKLVEANYDALIVGSDQVWTDYLTGGLDPVYLLNFDYHGLRISYAASIACGKVPDNEKDIFLKCLNKFDYISVREKSLADSINELCSVNVYTTLDPTLLMDCHEYSEILNNSSFKMKEKFVFAYFVVENEDLAQYARVLSQKLGIKLIELHYYSKKSYNPETQYSSFGPSEFLYAIANSEFVITNSFHGTVFSVLYSKRFYSVYNENARINNLLITLGLENRHLKSESEIDIIGSINYDQVHKKLVEYREASIKFLDKSLNEEKN